jgi:hypothetical protein
MANPSTISEMQRLELWRTRFEVASVAREDMFDRNFIYKKLWHLNDEDVEEIEEGKRKDRMFDLELEGMQAPQPEGAGVAPGEEMAGAPPPEGGEAPPPEAPPPEEPAAATPGMPPPPGEETPITANRDPNAQVSAPNELIKVKKRKKKKVSPDLLKHAFGIKKTAMDPKRSYSELTRMVKAPFGESSDPEEKVFKKNAMQLRKFAEDLEKVDVLKSAREKNTKKILSD